jgi:hypothetical protein
MRILSAHIIHLYCKLITYYFICAICSSSWLIRNQDTKLPIASSPNKTLASPGARGPARRATPACYEEDWDWLRTPRIFPCYFIFYSRLYLGSEYLLLCLDYPFAFRIFYFITLSSFYIFSTFSCIGPAHLETPSIFHCSTIPALLPNTIFVFVS